MRERMTSMLRALILAAMFVAATAAQSPEPAARLVFDVASVRPSQGPPTGISRPTNGVVRTSAAEVRRLIHYAYGIEPQQRDSPAIGGPEWIDREFYAIVARGPANMPLADGRAMMRSLLEDRFKLRVRVERRDAPVYALVVARKGGAPGSGMKPSAMDCRAWSDELLRTGRLAAAKEQGPDCGPITGGIGGGVLQVRGPATVRELITAIERSPDVDRKIVDRTDLRGTFDFDFRWTPQRSGPGAAAPHDVVSLFTALQEQLGLKLESQRAPVDTIIIDSIERPTPD